MRGEREKRAMRQREEEVGKEKEKVEEEHIGKPNTARVLDERKAPSSL